MAGKMTKCKTCNADISTTAESCPNCGAKLKRKMGCLGKLFISGLIIVVLGIAAVAILSTGVKQQSAQMEALPVSDLKFENLNEIYNLTSTYTELQKNEEWKKYKGKKINWIGEVSAIGEMLNTMTLQVKMKPESFTSDLLIRLKESEREKALKLKVGDKVTFIGVLAEWGTILPITLSEGEIVIAASSINTEVVQKEELVQAPLVSEVTFEMLDEIYNLKSTYTELQKNEEWKKYKDKNIKWTGEVSEIGEMFGRMTLQVKMKPESFTSDLLISLQESEREKALKLKVGDKVAFTGVLAEWGTILPITLNDGMIVIN